MTRNILYIHGAYASPITFSHMIEPLPDHRAASADYDCLTNSVEDVVRALKGTAAESFGGEPYSNRRPFPGRCRGPPPGGGRRTG